MTKGFYVLDGEGNVLYQGKERDDSPHRLPTFAAAEKKAHVAATCEPGVKFKIVEVVAVVATPVAPAKTTKVAG